MKTEGEWIKPQCTGTVPAASFGHTATCLGKTKVVLFGGAVEIDKKLVMTDSIYVLNIYKNDWKKIEGIRIHKLVR